MGTKKRLLYFIILNIFVSALTTWIVASMLLKNYSVPADAVSLDTSPAESQAEAAVDEETAAQDDAAASAENVNVTYGQLEIDTVIGAGDLESERVLVKHVGDEEVLLVGWQMQDEDGNVFEFPALTMFSGGAVTVHTKAGDSNVVDLYWGLAESIWSEGETVTLLDPNGNVQAVFQVP